MKSFWPRDGLLWYQNASESIGYPWKQFAPYLQKLISREDTVADLGCGIGMAAFAIAPLCRKVVAIDSDENTLEWMRKINTRANIEIVCASWPEICLQAVDVVVALYAHNMIHSAENVRSLYELACKGGFIACQSPSVDENGIHSILAKKLNIPFHRGFCNNACRTKGMLEAMGAKVECETLEYDFSQPLDTQEEVTRFLCWQMRVDETYKEAIEKNSRELVRFQDGKYIVPITRRSCVLSFWKKSNGHG